MRTINFLLYLHAAHCMTVDLLLILHAAQRTPAMGSSLVPAGNLQCKAMHH